MNIDVEILLKIRNNDELFFKYILNLTLNLILEEDNIQGVQHCFEKDSIRYLLEFIFKACTLSSFLINQTSEMDEEDLIAHSKVNFERIKNYIEKKDPTFNFLLESFATEAATFLK